MRAYFWLFLAIFTLCLCVINSTNDEKNSGDDEELFVPTQDWQVVQKGQKLPKHIHVRINFETGVTEAKLLDQEPNKKTRAIAEIPEANEDRAQNSNTKSEGNLKFSEEKLKEALKNIKNEYPDQQDEIERIKKNFRSYEELKKELRDLNLTPKTDAEIMNDLVMKYKKIVKRQNSEDFEKLDILEDLEFLVHQYDNANEFIRLNGFKEVIYQTLNSTNMDVKQKALKLLGSSMQNHPIVQIHALETGSVGILLRILALDTDYDVKNRALFALGGLLRRFPVAQLQFIENAGLSVLGELLEKSKSIKIQLKVVTLVNDLILEHNFAIEDTKSVNHSEKVRQYYQISLKDKLKDQSWCKNINKLLMSVIKIDSSDHDAVEKCLTAVYSIIDTCDVESYRSIKDIVLRLQNNYKTLASTEAEIDGDEPYSDYYTHLFDLCSQIMGYLNYKYKSEL